MSSITDAIQQLKENNVEDLTVSNSATYSDKEWKHFFRALKRNTSLKTLNLSGNQFGEFGSRKLRKSLKKNSTLKTLILESVTLGDYGAKKISRALKKNTSLTTLILFGNQIENYGAKKLKGALKKNSTLTTLELGNNLISESKYIEEIKEFLKRNGGSQ